MAVVEYPLCSNFGFRIHADGMAGIRVAVVFREVAAGDFQADAVPRLEHIAGRHQVDGVFVDLVRLDEGWCFVRVSVSCPDNAIEQDVGFARGSDVDELGREVGIWCRRLGEQLQHHRPGHFQV